MATGTIPVAPAANLALEVTDEASLALQYLNYVDELLHQLWEHIGTNEEIGRRLASAQAILDARVRSGLNDIKCLGDKALESGVGHG